MKEAIRMMKIRFLKGQRFSRVNCQHASDVYEKENAVGHPEHFIGPKMSNRISRAFRFREARKETPSAKAILLIDEILESCI